MQDNKYLIVLIFLIGLVVIEGKQINETICKGIPSDIIVLLPHPDNCSLYIECANEVPVVMPCPKGLHWNTLKRQCDFPEIANCKLNKTIQSDKFQVKKKWTSCEGVPENINVLLPNPGNCQTYIQCVHQKPVIQSCPSSLHWNVNANRCDWPELANCKTRTCEAVSETENLLLPNPNDCGTFIQCVHQKPVIRSCPVGLHWSASTNRCDWPHVAKCSVTKTSILTKTTDPFGSNKWTNCDSVPENIDVLLPNPKDCKTYIQCVHQKPMIRPCPSGLVWYAAMNRCDWPQIANCKANICEGVTETENVLLANPDNCGSFIQCVHQKPVVRPCPSGLHFSVASNRCDWPQIAQCNSNVNP